MTLGTVTLGSLASVAARATLLLAVAALADRTILRRASAAARHQLWTIAVGAVLLLPVIVVVGPSWDVPIPGLQTRLAAATSRPTATTPLSSQSMASPRPTPRSSSVGAITTPTLAVQPGTLPHPGPTAPTRSRVLMSWPLVLLAIYAAGVAVLLARVAREQIVVRRLERTATPERNDAWTTLLESLTSKLGIRRHVGLLRTSEPLMPLTAGVVRPFIMIPVDASDWPVERRRAVLLHELAHIVRHDCLTQTLAAIACAVYWPHPGIWWAVSRLRAERELACDDRAMAGGIRPRDYADHLLEIARTLHHPRRVAALAVGMAGASPLEQRLRAAIDTGRVRTAPGRRTMILGTVAAAIVFLPLAVVQSRPASAAPLGGALVVAAAPRGTLPPNVVQRPLGGTWNLRIVDPSEKMVGVAQGAGPVVHISMFTPGLNTFSIPLTRISGLTVTQITAGNKDARFQLRRDPGTFDFDGTFDRGRGTGRFTFTPDPVFAEELVRRGMQQPTPEQQFSLARHGLGIDYLDELAAQGYARPTTAGLVKAGSSGAELAELRELATLGYKLRTLEAATRLHSSGVSADYIRELQQAGYRGLSAELLVRAYNLDVTADFAREANARAGRQLTIGELVTLRARSEAAAPSPAAAPAAPADAPAAPTPDFAMTTALSGDWMLRAARGGAYRLDIDWDGNNQWARPITASELRGFPLAVLTGGPADVSFRLEQDAGVFEFGGTVASGRGSGRFRFAPNREFPATLRSIGIRDAGDATDHDLKNLAFGGISAAMTRELLALGVSVDLHGLVDLAIRQVTPEYARAMRAAEVMEAATASGIAELKFTDIRPEYATALAELGYRRLSGDQLRDMWRYAVTPEFIRQRRESGLKDETPEALIELRRRQ